MAASSSRKPPRPIEFYGTSLKSLSKITLQESDGSSAEINPYCAQITSWKNKRGEELLFVKNNKVTSEPREPILGGIGVCFPKFQALGSLGNHVFARNWLWRVDNILPPMPPDSSIRSYVDLILEPTDLDLIRWPHRFEIRLKISLGPGGELKLRSCIKNVNTNGKSFSFSFAYPSYFSVSDISDVRIEGLETLDRLDNLQNGVRSTETADALTFHMEIDKVYLSAPKKIAILDHGKRRTFVIFKDGLPDAAVWNPWEKETSWILFGKKPKVVADFGKEDYMHMVCVGASVVEKPVTLKPGEVWKGWQKVSVAPSSYYSGELDPLKVLASQ